MKKKKNKTFENSKKLALSSIICALCFIMMYIGAVTGVFDLCAAVLSAMFIIVAVIEIGGIYPWLIWASCSVLCLLLLPDKFVALEFAFFGGIYPMAKAFFERRHPAVAWIMKIIYFNVVFISAVFIAKKVFMMTDIGFELKIFSYVIANLFFIFLDICLSRLVVIYRIKIRPRLRIGK